jgi:uncharacterized SAM-binding protein YcdF (DUF218 family)
VAPLEQSARAAAAQAPACCYTAIVVLGGGGTDLRIKHGAALYEKGIAGRVIVSGGDLASNRATTSTEAEAMKHLLVLLGVPADAIIAENAARNTAENIANVREIVGDQPVALVTSAYHMERAMRLARRGALKAYAFPTDFAPNPGERAIWENWLPTIEGLRQSITALWEYLGIAFDYRPVKPTGA